MKTSDSPLLTVPNHIAIIMDGNRRWAREHGLPILKGHQKVADEVIEPLVDRAAELGIKYITLWAFSTENWNRSKIEVAGLMQIFRHLMKDRLERLHEKGFKLRVIGDISKFPEDIQDSLRDVIEKTKNNPRITVIFALNYGGRDELLRAIRNLQISKSTNKQINNQIEKMTENEFAQYLDTSGIPDPDLIIRTGGEQRLSGFLLWQSNYAELYFPTFYMPDFSPEKLNEALEEYASRKRRFGK